mmetsp:Transcript_107488/g.309465  ORF Transcript_107488/g.309465 Transcript_107488/m.309465 type:complete len:302 (-) Transcript_107488:106-1011(-)
MSTPASALQAARTGSGTLGTRHRRRHLRRHRRWRSTRRIRARRGRPRRRRGTRPASRARFAAMGCMRPAPKESCTPAGRTRRSSSTTTSGSESSSKSTRPRGVSSKRISSATATSSTMVFVRDSAKRSSSSTRGPMISCESSWRVSRRICRTTGWRRSPQSSLGLQVERPRSSRSGRSGRVTSPGPSSTYSAACSLSTSAPGSGALRGPRPRTSSWASSWAALVLDSASRLGPASAATAPFCSSTFATSSAAWIARSSQACWRRRAWSPPSARRCRTAATTSKITCGTSFASAGRPSSWIA